MRNFLLAFSALFCASLPAHAEIKLFGNDTAKLTASGDIRFLQGFIDEDRVQRTVDRSQLEGNFKLKASVKGSENIPDYGAYLRVQKINDRDYTLKHLYGWVDGRLGRLEFGDYYGAIGQLAVRPPAVGFGQADGKQTRFLDSNLESRLALFDMDDEESSKISYFAPKLGIFSSGISYTARFSPANEGVARYSGAAKDVVYHNMIQGAVKAEWQGFNVSASVAGAPAKTNGFNSLFGYGLGGQYVQKIGSGTASFGASWLDEGDSLARRGTDSDRTETGFGVTYKQGVWGFGLSAAIGDVTDAGVSRNTRLYTGGVSYDLNEYINISSDISRFNHENGLALGTDNDGWLNLWQVKAAF